MRQYRRIAIVGVGLIGGSIGLALKKKKLAKEIIGIGHRASSIRKALRLKTIDKGTLDIRAGVRDADIVIMATPVLTIPVLARKISGSLKKGAILTDVGSVKGYLIKELEKILPKSVSFVGAHPMAGSEERGVDKAKKDLFEGSVCIITRTKKTGRDALERVKRLWKKMGSEVSVVSPSKHDKIVSEISHLPHMAIFAYLNSIENKSLEFASTGFFDTTRIASSDAKIWKDIAISNRAEILGSINSFRTSLRILETAIRDKNSILLLSLFKKARKKRDDHSNRRPGRKR